MVNFSMTLLITDKELIKSLVDMIQHVTAYCQMSLPNVNILSLITKDILYSHKRANAVSVAMPHTDVVL